MKISQVTLLLAFVIVAPFAPVFGDCPEQPLCQSADIKTWCTEEFPSVSAVTIGSPLSLARASLGDTVREPQARYDEVFQTSVIALEYNGLILEAIKQEQDEQFEVSRITSTSQMWVFDQCPSVGAPRSEVISNFGAPESTRFIDDTEVLFYSLCPFDINLNLSVHDGKVIEVQLWLDWT